VIWTDIDTETRSAIQIVVIPAAMLRAHAGSCLSGFQPLKPGGRQSDLQNFGLSIAYPKLGVLCEPLQKGARRGADTAPCSAGEDSRRIGGQWAVSRVALAMFLMAIGKRFPLTSTLTALRHRSWYISSGSVSLYYVHCLATS
jgi:hypothetical protein